jgi:hypothetical protein
MDKPRIFLGSSGNRRGFAFELSEPLRRRREVVGQHLDRDVALEPVLATVCATIPTKDVA